MSIISAVYIPDGIIMAADSRLTGHNMVSQSENTKIINNYTLSDCGQKIILLKKNHVGISACGDAVLDSKTVSDFLRIFEINQVLSSDTAEIIVKKLYEYIKHTNCNVQFMVCGYDNDEPFVFDVTRDEYKRANFDEHIIYGVSWRGKIDAAIRLFNSEPHIKIPFGLMQLKDGIDLSEFIIETTIKYERFMDGIQTCGGPIDILAITKDDAFWYRHKVFKSTK